MADQIDIANDLIDAEVSRALGKLRQHKMEGVIGSKICVECGDTIPDQRRELGFKRCVSCAHETERRRQLFAEG